MTTLPPAQLDYAPARHPSAARLTRRAVVTLTALALILIAAKWLPPAADHLRLLHHQSRCLAHAPAAPASPMLSDDTAREWEQFYALLSPPGGRHDATAFLHERRHKSGARRLVAVEAYAIDCGLSGRPDAFTHLSWRVIEPGRLTAAPTQRGGSIWPIPRPAQSIAPLRLYPGQPDPNDSTHFTIPYEHAGKPGVLDAWLREDDTILFELRDPLPTTRLTSLP